MLALYCCNYIRACGLVGYDVAFTRRRSGVRIPSGPLIFLKGCRGTLKKVLLYTNPLQLFILNFLKVYTSSPTLSVKKNLKLSDLFFRHKGGVPGALFRITFFTVVPILAGLHMDDDTAAGEPGFEVVFDVIRKAVRLLYR